MAFVELTSSMPFEGTSKTLASCPVVNLVSNLIRESLKPRDVICTETDFNRNWIQHTRWQWSMESLLRVTHIIEHYASALKWCGKGATFQWTMYERVAATADNIRFRSRIRERWIRVTNWRSSVDRLRSSHITLRGALHNNCATLWLGWCNWMKNKNEIALGTAHLIVDHNLEFPSRSRLRVVRNQPTAL